MSAFSKKDQFAHLDKMAEYLDNHEDAAFAESALKLFYMTVRKLGADVESNDEVYMQAGFALQDVLRDAMSVLTTINRKGE